MKKIILILNLLVAATSAKAQNVYALGFWKPDSSVWVSGFPGNISPYISPATANLYSGGPSATFKAVALDSNAGWKVEAWYLTHSLSAVSAGDIISGSEGRNELEWKYDGQVVQDCLSVKYAYITYAVKYAGDGNGIPSGTSSVGYTNEFLLAAAPTRTGWTFAGWQDGSGNIHQPGVSVSGSSFSELKDVHADGHEVVLTAKWNANTYTISGAATNGSLTISPDGQAAYTNDIEIAWAPGADVGYDYSLTSVKVYAGTDAGGKVLKTFTSGNGAKFNLSSIGQYDSSVFVEVVYARTAHKYPVTVSAGSNGTVEQNPYGSTFPYGQLLELVARPSDGYAFEKWSDGFTDSNRSLTITQAVSLVATFTNRVYTLTLDANDGKFSDESVRKTLFVEYEAYVENLPGKNEVKQYLKTLKGWFTAESGGTQIDSTSRYVWTKDVTLYAQWDDAPALVVVVEASPADGGTVDGGGSFERGAITTLTATPNEGYSFAAWSDGGAQSHDVTVDANAKYVATFTGNVYQVRFAWDDPDVSGTITPASRDYTFGQPYGELPVAIPNSPDYQFAGWVDSDGNEITAESVMNKHEKRNTLYALLAARPFYTIRFHGNGATAGGMSSQKAYCGEDAQLTANAYVWPAHRFVNWTNDVGKVFEDGATVRDLAGEGGEVTLYACWKELTLAEAMHCGNLEWSNQVYVGKPENSEKWEIFYGENVGSNSWSCVRQAPTKSGFPQVLTSEVLTSAGTLTFYWKPTNGASGLFVWCDGDEAPTRQPLPISPVMGSEGVWQQYTFNVELKDLERVYIHIFNWDLEATIDIDQVVWTPDSPVPTPDEPVAIESASVAGGLFRLGVLGEKGVDYGVWTNADLTVPAENWGFMTNQVGVGAPFEFELKILPNEPKLFYRAYKVK